MSFPTLPCPVIDLIPQRPPMLVIDRLLERDRELGSARVAATLPILPMFIAGGRVLPEVLIELLAQAMAAVNGYDVQMDGGAVRMGFLVGVDGFTWQSLPAPGADIVMDIEKKFEFGAVTIMTGKILDGQGRVIAFGEIKAWEEER